MGEEKVDYTGSIILILLQKRQLDGTTTDKE